MDTQRNDITPPKQNGKTIATLVLGILSITIPYLGFILGIIAIVLGHQTKKELNQNGGEGRSMAVAGFVCGIVGTSLWVLLDLFIAIGLIAFFSVTHETTTTIFK